MAPQPSYQRLLQLLESYGNNQLSREEELELLHLLGGSSNEETIKEWIGQKWESEGFENLLSSRQSSSIYQGILQQINPELSQKGKVINIWKKLAVAASLLLLIGIAALLFIPRVRTTDPSSIAEKNPSTDIPAPQYNKAMITLGDGRKLALDSLSSMKQGLVQLKKTGDGQIVYQGTEKEMIYNTLSNPRGSTVVDLQLADGSRVWLNAGSSITYPVAFIGNERRVSITGEAYFEITKRATPQPRDYSNGHLNSSDRWPFIVSNNNITLPGGSIPQGAGWAVQVLGTHFNVNAYSDEPIIKVTLLEGRVNVKQGTSNELLYPGQQAQMKNTINVVKNINTEEVMAWKNGRFVFKDADIESLMRQVSRWYDVEVSYEAVPETALNAKITKETSLRSLLKALELTGKVKFRMEGRNVTVVK